MRKTWLSAMLLLACALGVAARAASYPAPAEADFIVIQPENPAV
jgi:hypothetical protein